MIELCRNESLRTYVGEFVMENSNNETSTQPGGFKNFLLNSWYILGVIQNELGVTYIRVEMLTYKLALSEIFYYRVLEFHTLVLKLKKLDPLKPQSHFATDRSKSNIFLYTGARVSSQYSVYFQKMINGNMSHTSRKCFALDKIYRSHKMFYKIEIKFLNEHQWTHLYFLVIKCHFWFTFPTPQNDPVLVDPIS